MTKEEREELLVQNCTLTGDIGISMYCITGHL